MRIMTLWKLLWEGVQLIASNSNAFFILYWFEYSNGRKKLWVWGVRSRHHDGLIVITLSLQAACMWHTINSRNKQSERYKRIAIERNSNCPMYKQQRTALKMDRDCPWAFECIFFNTYRKTKSIYTKQQTKFNMYTATTIIWHQY
jgi:hypothetical protein